MTNRAGTAGQSLDRATPALALSGGGFRAVLFHCGALMRLNELGVLSRITRISSVSGGAIANG
ncbi:MAG TPA: patatin-like phospholipase family protein, partial [Xanthobacteraceae bacterium]|nr:patatin-like phospholipase family protein [Xanthobacteraceae bacterium]